jgi:hypothetical protein
MFLVVLGQNERALNWDACLKYEQEINCNQELGHLETLSIRMHVDEPVTVPRMHGAVPFHVEMAGGSSTCHGIVDARVGPC